MSVSPDSARMATAAERKTLSMGTLPIVSTNTSLSPRAVYVSRHPFRNGLITRVNLPLHFLCATEAISAKETEPRDELENDTHAPLVRLIYSRLNSSLFAQTCVERGMFCITRIFMQCEVIVYDAYASSG